MTKCFRKVFSKRLLHNDLAAWAVSESIFFSNCRHAVNVVYSDTKLIDASCSHYLSRCRIPKSLSIFQVGSVGCSRSIIAILFMQD